MQPPRQNLQASRPRPDSLDLRSAPGFWALGMVILAVSLNAELNLIGADWEVSGKVAIQASWALALSVCIAIALPPLKAISRVSTYIAFFNLRQSVLVSH